MGHDSHSLEEHNSVPFPSGDFMTSFPFFDNAAIARLPTMRATAKSLVESLDVIFALVLYLIGFSYLYSADKADWNNNYTLLLR